MIKWQQKTLQPLRLQGLYLAEKPGFELGLIVTICVYLFNLVTNLLLFVQDAPNSSIW